MLGINLPRGSHAETPSVSAFLGARRLCVSEQLDVPGVSEERAGTGLNEVKPSRKRSHFHKSVEGARSTEHVP